MSMGSAFAVAGSSALGAYSAFNSEMERAKQDALNAEDQAVRAAEEAQKLAEKEAERQRKWDDLRNNSAERYREREAEKALKPERSGPSMSQLKNDILYDMEDMRGEIRFLLDEVANLRNQIMDLRMQISMGNGSDMYGYQSTSEVRNPNIGPLSMDYASTLY